MIYRKSHFDFRFEKILNSISLAPSPSLPLQQIGCFGSRGPSETDCPAAVIRPPAGPAPAQREKN